MHDTRAIISKSLIQRGRELDRKESRGTKITLLRNNYVATKIIKVCARWRYYINELTAPLKYSFIKDIRFEVSPFS